MNRISHIFSLLSSYLFLLAWNGYTFGQGDMIELLPYAKWMVDPSLYPNDFYLQHTVDNFPDKRYVLVKLFYWLNGGKWLAFMLHFSCSIFLLEGLYRIAKKYITSEILNWAAILLPITILFGKNLGGNEMYIPLFISSTMAKAMGIWAVYYFLSKENRIKTIYALLILAAFIQPLVSAQLFCLITGVFVIERCLLLLQASSPETPHVNIQSAASSAGTPKATTPKLLSVLLAIISYVCTAGLWIYVMNRTFSTTTIDTQLLFDCYEFRASHHYMPSYFPMKYYVLLIPSFLFGMLYFFKHERRLFYFFGLAMLGCVFYWIGVEQLQLSSILASQWFKSTVWLKAFSFMVIFAWIDHLMPIFRKSKLLEKGFYTAMFVVAIFSIFIFIKQPALPHFAAQSYDLPFFKAEESRNQEIDIAVSASELTPKNATFLIPFSNSHFKYWSERSSYVEFKGFVHQQGAIPEWYERIKKVYNVDVGNKRRGENLVEIADGFYHNLSVEALKNFQAKGVTHLLTFKDVDLPFKKLVSNEVYTIYEL